jgi:hypothetical protein
VPGRAALLGQALALAFLFASGRDAGSAEEPAACGSLKASVLTFPWQTLRLAYVVTADCQVRIRLWDPSDSADALQPRIRSTPARDQGRASVEGSDIVVRALPGRAEPILLEVLTGASDGSAATIVVGSSVDGRLRPSDRPR